MDRLLKLEIRGSRGLGSISIGSRKRREGRKRKVKGIKGMKKEKGVLYQKKRDKLLEKLIEEICSQISVIVLNPEKKSLEGNVRTLQEKKEKVCRHMYEEYKRICKPDELGLTSKFSEEALLVLRIYRLWRELRELIEKFMEGHKK